MTPVTQIENKQTYQQAALCPQTRSGLRCRATLLQHWSFWKGGLLSNADLAGKVLDLPL